MLKSIVTTIFFMGFALNASARAVPAIFSDVTPVPELRNASLYTVSCEACSTSDVFTIATNMIGGKYGDDSIEIDSIDSARISTPSMFELLTEERPAGEAPYNEAEVASLTNYLAASSGQIEIVVVTVTGNYMGGTGVVSHFLVYDLGFQKLLVLDRVTYEE